MKSFFKTLGSGIIYTILSPIFLAMLAVGMVYAILSVIISAILFIICFFSGRNYLEDKENAELKKRKKSFHSGAMPGPVMSDPRLGPINVGNHNPGVNQGYPNNYYNQNGGNNNG